MVADQVGPLTGIYWDWGLGLAPSTDTRNANPKAPERIPAWVKSDRVCFLLLHLRQKFGSFFFRGRNRFRLYSITLPIPCAVEPPVLTFRFSRNAFPNRTPNIVLPSRKGSKSSIQFRDWPSCFSGPSHRVENGARSLPCKVPPSFSFQQQALNFFRVTKDLWTMDINQATSLCSG